MNKHWTDRYGHFGRGGLPRITAKKFIHGIIKPRPYVKKYQWNEAGRTHQWKLEAGVRLWKWRPLERE